MAKSLSLLFCMLVAVPAVILCKPQPQIQQEPQISPPHPSGISTFPVAPPSEDNNSTQVIGDDAVRVPGGIGNHVQPGVIVHEPEPTDKIDAQPSPVNFPTPSDGCPKIFRPLCGSDQKTYNSPCEFQIAQRSDSSLKKEKDGSC